MNSELFDIPADVTYLNCAYMSPQLRQVTEAGRAAVDRLQHPWELDVEDFFVPAERLRGLFATLLGRPDDADGVAIIPAVSYGVAVAVANLELSAGDEIIVLADQFPSHVYAWREAAKAAGGRVVTVPRRDDRTWAEGVVEAIGPRTAVVAVPHVHWTDGSVVDLVEVGEAARQAGAAVVVDATQSLGAMPFPIAGLEPDFLVAAAYKWLLGPYSLAFLWAAPHRRAGTPIEHGWIVREGAEDFSRLVEYTDRFQPGARRFDVGERSNFVLVPMAIAALEQLLEWGVDYVAATLEGTTAHIARLAAERGLQPTPADRRACHMLGLRVPGGPPDGLAGELASEKVYVSVRGDSIRVSPHLYNDVGDVDRFFSVLDRLLGRR